MVGVEFGLVLPHNVEVAGLVSMIPAMGENLLYMWKLSSYCRSYSESQPKEGLVISLA